MKLLSVAIPCYNSEAYMRGCVDSLLTGGERVELLIIDDGSTDATGQIADEYAAKFPGIVRAIHQENGGHGEGINAGLRNATGVYYKIVDSDDAVSGDFPAFLDALEACEREGGVDLFLTNYRYVQQSGHGDHTVSFGNALPAGRIFTWKDTKRFRIDQILMIHTATYRTELLRKTGLEMPKHLFYEDNYFVYGNLQSVTRLYYMDCDLYRYTIGREGQSVQESTLIRRYRQQLKASELCFMACHLDEIRDRRQKRYMRHELLVLLGIAVTVARLSTSPDAEKDMEQMWEHCRRFDSKWAAVFRRRTLLRYISASGQSGRLAARKIYALAHRVVRFN